MNSYNLINVLALFAFAPVMLGLRVGVTAFFQKIVRFYMIHIVWNHTNYPPCKNCVCDTVIVHFT